MGDQNNDGNPDDDGNGKVDDFVGWDFVDNDNDPSPKVTPGVQDSPEHGTNVAGTIAARINNAEGVAGVAGESRILPLRVTTGGTGKIESAKVREAIQYAVQIAAADPSVRHLVINLGLDTDELAGTDLDFLTAIDNAYNAGALIVQSAGNGGADAIGDADPTRAFMGQVVTVTGSGVNNVHTDFMNFGKGIDLVAPGFTFTTSWNPASVVDIYQQRAGSSIAAATVSGVAALVWSQNPTFTRDQVLARLMGTATNLDTVPGNEAFAGGLGHGMVNAAAAVNSSVAIPAPTVEAVQLIDASTGTGINVIEADFRRTLDPATARRIDNYELRSAGANGQFDDADDRVFTLVLGSTAAPAFYYSANTNNLRFEVQAGSLPLGNYRMRFKNTGPTGLRDPFGTPLAGTTDHFFQITSGKGRTGDVITVDLKQTLGGTAFGIPTFSPLTTRVDEDGDLHLFQGTEEIGEVILSERVEGTSAPFLTTGRFYFVPESAAVLNDANPNARGFQGVISAQSQVDGTPRDFSDPGKRGILDGGPEFRRDFLWDATNAATPETPRLSGCQRPTAATHGFRQRGHEVRDSPVQRGDTWDQSELAIRCGSGGRRTEQQDRPSVH